MADAAGKKVQQIIDDNAVGMSPALCLAPPLVFSKSYCPHCKATKKTLNNLGADYTALELDNECTSLCPPDSPARIAGADEQRRAAECSALQDALEQLTGQRTVPNILIQQKHIGGNSDLQALFKSGKLADLLRDSGALKA
ncbi:Glutaredoxin [Tolypocladium paradoxum]|uniref:Glutaredoxin n=1 Tax=Tolypocladium paradoxum TaxID=94208 RepID=A0A2S4KN05_9HYPO|nr:Glutaredoxin [Tolypocladium paradoxum]